MRSMSLSNLKLLFMLIVLFPCIVIFIDLTRQNGIPQKTAFLWNDSVVNRLRNSVKVTTGWKTVTKKVPNDDPYSTILHVDKMTPFLDPEARRFLHNSRNFTFPSKYKKVFVDTLVEFDRIWRQKLNRTYILYYGTLLGAYRHGQTIPWDDDLDVLVDLKYKKTFKQDFNGTKFATSYIAAFCKLFFTHNGTTTTGYGHWPFIDVFFFERALAGSKNIETVGYDLVYRINDVFPVIPISFEGHTFLGPRCPRRVIQITSVEMVTTKCCTNFYSHRLHRRMEGYCILCSKLYGLFRFITWRLINATHSQQMTSEPPEPHNMAAVYKSKKEVWEKGPVVFMPEC